MIARVTLNAAIDGVRVLGRYIEGTLEIESIACDPVHTGAPSCATGVR